MTPRDVDAERLALLLEGKLSAADRAKLIEELEQTPELREAFADAAAVVGEVGLDSKRGDAPATPITSAPSLRRRVIGLAIAAGLLLALLVPLTRSARRSVDLPEPALVVAMLGTGTYSPLEAKPWRELRGAGQPLPSQARAVRIGALVADLELTAARQDTSTVRIAARIASLADEYPGGSAVGDSYRAITVASSASSRSDARRSMETLVGARELRVGAWLETARVAAAARDSSFFASPTTAMVLQAAATLAKGHPAASIAVHALSTALASPARDWSAIGAASDKVMAVLADAL